MRHVYACTCIHQCTPGVKANRRCHQNVNMRIVMHTFTHDTHTHIRTYTHMYICKQMPLLTDVHTYRRLTFSDARVLHTHTHTHIHNCKIHSLDLVIWEPKQHMYLAKHHMHRIWFGPKAFFPVRFQFLTQWPYGTYIVCTLYIYIYIYIHIYIHT